MPTPSSEPSPPPESGPRLTVVVVDHPFDDLDAERRILGEIGAEVIDAQVTTEAEAAAACRYADGVLVRRFPLRRTPIQAMERCRIICNYGAGYDNVNVAAARERGIEVAATAGYGDDEVAGHTLALLLALARRIVAQRDALAADSAAAAGDGSSVGWSHTPYVPVRRLQGQTLGLFGFGRIGRTVARKAAALDLRVIACDPFATAADAAELGVRLVSKDELLAHADFVSLHAPLTSETRHLIGAAELAAMKPTAYVINCARGGLVDQAALQRALAEGRLAGAGLDVLEQEPPPPATLRALLASPNVIVTPHVAWYSEEAIADRQRLAAETVRRALAPASPGTSH
jgi:D-3-phosphoglycerate dehydrogenase / 2-oxoglutarate reductase